ncbi:MAG: hypothetical protein OXJ52_08135 [Oligoflexia bacterium]|nr:hypothetical protein [Oligoflexia bacterium]
MKFCFILLGVFSLSSWAERYERGNKACTNKSEEYYRQDSENIRYQYLYGACLVIKGQDAKGLVILYHLADHKSLVTANYFVADYLGTDGKFADPLTRFKIDEAIYYQERTLALINSLPTYPEPDYWAYERQNQMELQSVYDVPYFYMIKYKLGAIGDYRKHLFQSPSYQGDRNKELYPNYNPYTLDSLDNVARYAEECASQPQKRHFAPLRYKATVETCRLMKELALTLIPLEEKRQEILLQPKCADLNKTNCPEYYETHQEIADFINDYNEEAERIFKPVINS